MPIGCGKKKKVIRQGAGHKSYAREQGKALRY